MRFILLLQSLVIIAGAYYIYTLRQGGDASVESPIGEEVTHDVFEVASTTTPPEAVPIATTTPDLPIAGPNDAGMEWPILEAEQGLQAQ